MTLFKMLERHLRQPICDNRGRKVVPLDVVETILQMTPKELRQFKGYMLKEAIEVR